MLSLLAMQNVSIAQTVQAVSKQAVADFTRSEALRLAAEARSLMQSASDPQLIALLSLRSINTQYTAEEDAALTGAAALPIPKKIFTDLIKVYSANFSPDGNLLATGGAGQSMRLWDIQTGQEPRRFIDHKGPVDWGESESLLDGRSGSKNSTIVEPRSSNV